MYYDSQGNAILCTSEPNYDNWGPDQYWSCIDWINYHKTLKTCYSQAEANTIWVNKLSQYSLFGHEWNCMNFDNSFIDYAQSQGIDAGIFGTVYNSGSGAVNNAATSLEFLTKLIKPLTLTAIAYGGYYFLVKKK